MSDFDVVRKKAKWLLDATPRSPHFAGAAQAQHVKQYEDILAALDRIEVENTELKAEVEFYKNIQMGTYGYEVTNWVAEVAKLQDRITDLEAENESLSKLLGMDADDFKSNLAHLRRIEEAARELLAADDAWIMDFGNPRLRARVVRAKVDLRAALDRERSKTILGEQDHDQG